MWRCDVFWRAERWWGVTLESEQQDARGAVPGDPPPGTGSGYSSVLGHLQRSCSLPPTSPSVSLESPVLTLDQHRDHASASTDPWGLCGGGGKSAISRYSRIRLITDWRPIDIWLISAWFSVDIQLIFGWCLIDFRLISDCPKYLLMPGVKGLIEVNGGLSLLT